MKIFPWPARCVKGGRLAAVLIALPFLLAGCATGPAPHTTSTAFLPCSAAVAHPSGSVRHVRDELTDSPPWQPSASGETYTNPSSRGSDYYDSDISGAPLHSAGGSGTGGKVVYGSCGAPASHDREVRSIVSISYTCYYQAVTPGVHNPDTDSFLGCDVAVAADSTTGQSNVIGAHKGAPVDGATCSGSPEGIGDTISILTSPDTSVADINALWNGNKVEGWMYIGDDKTRFIQFNYQNQAGVSGGISWGKGPITGGIGGSSPGGYSGIYKWDGSLPPGTRVRKCFTKGAQLV